MTFTFSEDALKTALLANGWSIGWGGEDDWVAPGVNADYGSVSFKKAVETLMMSKNLVPSNMKEFWK